MEEVSATADRAERERAGNGNNQRHVFDIGADTLTDLFPRKPRALNGTTNIKKSFFFSTNSFFEFHGVFFFVSDIQSPIDLVQKRK